MRRMLTVGLLVLGTTACSDPSTTWRADLVSRDVAAVDGETIELPGGVVARFGDDCGQLEIGDERTDCPAWVDDGSGMTSVLRVGGDTRIVWVTHRGTDQDDHRMSAIDHAVVWSDRSPQGRELEAAVAGDLQQVAWVLEDGEEAWGMQLIDARGRLIATQHLGDLPTD